MLGRLLDRDDERPQQVVINAGTNDAIQGYQGWQAAFDEMWSMVEDRDCVVYVTIEEILDKRPGANGTAAAINQRIRELATAHPDRVVIADWAAEVETAWLIDGIHALPEGQRVTAELVRDALDRC